MPKKTKEKNKKVAKKKSKKESGVEKFDFREEMVIGLKKAPESQKKKKPNKDKKEPQKNKKVEKDIELGHKTKKKNVRKKPPSKAKKFMKKAMKYIIILLVFTTILVFFMLSPLFNITKIDVKGNKILSSELIVNLSEISLNENIFKINKQEAMKKIKSEPYVESVEISRILPGDLEILIRERQATYMLEFANGYVYINNQGYMLEVSDDKVEVPIIVGYRTQAEGIAPGKRLIREDLHILETILRVMEAAKSNEVAEYITKIDITSSINIKLILEGEEKIAHVGDCTSINTRMQHLKLIIEKEKGKKGEAFINGDMNESSSTFRESIV